MRSLRKQGAAVSRETDEPSRLHPTPVIDETFKAGVEYQQSIGDVGRRS
jgi:hypothetical protein